jgi:hypothetical protein
MHEIGDPLAWNAAIGELLFVFLKNVVLPGFLSRLMIYAAFFEPDDAAAASLSM